MVSYMKTKTSKLDKIDRVMLGLALGWLSFGAVGLTAIANADQLLDIPPSNSYHEGTP